MPLIHDVCAYVCLHSSVCLCTSTLPSPVQECCYSPSGSLINTEDGRGGQTFFYHPRLSSLHHKYDVLPKHWCCNLTDNCHLFYEVLPMDRCNGYTPLFTGPCSVQWLHIINASGVICCTGKYKKAMMCDSYIGLNICLYYCQGWNCLRHAICLWKASSEIISVSRSKYIKNSLFSKTSNTNI